MSESESPPTAIKRKKMVMKMGGCMTTGGKPLPQQKKNIQRYWVTTMRRHMDYLNHKVKREMTPPPVLVVTQLIAKSGELVSTATGYAPWDTILASQQGKVVVTTSQEQESN